MNAASGLRAWALEVPVRVNQKTLRLTSTIFAALVLTHLAACQSQLMPNPEALAPPSQSAVAPDSVYQVETVWSSSTGKRFRLAELRGQPVVITMGFTSCEYSCPIVMGRLKRIESALSPGSRSRVKFVYVSFDTVRDTPEALERHRKRLNLSPDRWLLLHGNEEEVMELGVVLGIKYRPDQKEGFSHSNIITILDEEGRSVAHQEGLNSGIEPLVAAVEGKPPTK